MAHWTPEGLGSGVLGGGWMDGPPSSLLQAPVAPATLSGGAGLQQLCQACWDHTAVEVVGSGGAAMGAWQGGCAPCFLLCLRCELLWGPRRGG